jgi:hypothetical protein
MVRGRSGSTPTSFEARKSAHLRMTRQTLGNYPFVMAGLVPAMHVSLTDRS